METLVVVVVEQHRNQYYRTPTSPCRSFREINCRTFQSGVVGVLPTPLKPSYNSPAVIRKACSSPPRTPTPTFNPQSNWKASSSVPIRIKANNLDRSFSDDLSFSELWAGPTYSNSPPPSSLPIPKFSLHQKPSVSLDVPVLASKIAVHPIAKSAPASPTRGFFLSTDSATRDLRRILHLDDDYGGSGSGSGSGPCK